MLYRENWKIFIFVRKNGKISILGNNKNIKSCGIKYKKCGV